MVRDAEPDHVLEAPELSMAPDAPIVLLDADTGQRHPYWAEMDEHAVTIADGADRMLIVRPLRNLEEGHRYIVALRDLRDADGAELAAPAAFTALRDGWTPPAVGEVSCPPPGQGHGKGVRQGPLQAAGQRRSLPPPTSTPPTVMRATTTSSPASTPRASTSTTSTWPGTSTSPPPRTSPAGPWPSATTPSPSSATPTWRTARVRGDAPPMTVTDVTDRDLRRAT